mmetsp:Transcript_134808/g.340937  ORF Transcript_134808/g.340937 Transcript_134808/m.340937 type:complete len:303 (+) Transcript_134808:56-964(+)
MPRTQLARCDTIGALPSAQQRSRHDPRCPAARRLLAWTQTGDLGSPSFAGTCNALCRGSNSGETSSLLCSQRVGKRRSSLMRAMIRQPSACGDAPTARSTPSTTPSSTPASAWSHSLRRGGLTGSCSSSWCESAAESGLEGEMDFPTRARPIMNPTPLEAGETVEKAMACSIAQSIRCSPKHIDAQLASPCLSLGGTEFPHQVAVPSALTLPERADPLDIGRQIIDDDAMVDTESVARSERFDLHDKASAVIRRTRSKFALVRSLSSVVGLRRKTQDVAEFGFRSVCLGEGHLHSAHRTRDR